MNRMKGLGSVRLDDSTGEGADVNDSESAAPVVFQPVKGNILATNVAGTA